ncbi:hypothetical protein ABIQ69_00445 [Agromyces sp. G08B096]|uniref:VOC family protein n=1 Tax=Agromyces sp. G08B096 TaxID=3156399 RepID=A0AAU7W716_9MICO
MGTIDVDPFDSAVERAKMVAVLPCGDIDQLAAFWSALGLSIRYRQIRPNPYVALGAGAIDLHYYGLPDWDPDGSHSTCAIAVPDPRPLNDRFRAGLRALYGTVPVSGAPRITRARERANNGGLSGFSLIDPAGNWIRVTRSAEQEPPASDGTTTSWTSTAGSPVAKALENAVVIGDSHGDAAQARKVLAGALRRAGDIPDADRAAALGYLVELLVRLDEPQAAHDALAQLEALAAVAVDHDGTVAVAVAEARDTVTAASTG